MTALSVPNTSNRGCPSSLAGTTCPRDRSPISATALRSTIRCRTDRSGPFRQCVTHAWLPRLSTTVPAYGRPATTSHTRTPKTAQHAATCPPEPFPGLPIGDKRPFPLLTVSAPNSSQKYNSLQNGGIADNPILDLLDALGRVTCQPSYRRRPRGPRHRLLRRGSHVAVLPTCISATDANPCTPPGHQNRLPEAVESASDGTSTASTSALGSLAAV